MIQSWMAALRRVLEDTPAVIDVVTSRDAVSSVATKGLGFLPEHQSVTAWDDAEHPPRCEI